MAESVYKVVELVGTSSESWEKAAAVAVERAARILRDLRIAEVTTLDMHIKNGKIKTYRARMCPESCRKASWRKAPAD